MAGAVNIGMFIAFRFVAGAAAFMVLAAVPILMNEIAPVHMRGALVDVHAVMLVLGYTIQGWVGFGFYFWQSGVSPHFLRKAVPFLTPSFFLFR